MKKGQSLVELLIAISLSAIMLPALLTGLLSSREGKATQQQKFDAVALTNESIDALRNIREAGWDNIATNGEYHLYNNGNSWELRAGSETLNGFTRTIIISDVERDPSGAIVPSGGTIDPSVKKISIRISWETPSFYETETIYYLARYLSNTTSSQTTESDFNSGILTDAIVTNNSGGEVTLGSGGRGVWCQPTLSITALDLPKNGVANGISAIEGRIFAGTGDNASGESFVKVGVTDDFPPVASILGVFNNYKTNAVFGEDNYGYIATDTNSKEIVILNIATLPYSEIGYFDSPGNTDANSIVVVGNTGYMTAGNKFYNFDLTNKTGGRSAIDSDGITLAGVGTRMAVVSNYAYVSIAGSPTKMQIIDLSNPSNLIITGQAVMNASDGKDVFVNETGTRAYLATGTWPGFNEMFILDITNKNGNQPVVGSYDTNGMDPKGITVVPGNNAIIVGSAGEEYQVVNIADETLPVRCGGLNIDTGVNGVSSVLEADGDAYSYIITGDSGSELKIIDGGPGGRYSNEGTFESAVIDIGSEVAFNRFSVNFTEPAQTDITFQVAVADAVNGNCTEATYNFVGPDGLPKSYFSLGGIIPISNDGSGYENPGRCFKLKAYLSTNEYTAAPVLYDFFVNYSP